MGAGGSLRVNPEVLLPAGEIQVEFARSGGPGGQRVNKVETKVILRFSIEQSSALGEVQKGLLRTALASRITAAGEIIIRADRFRDRVRNLEDARTRLADLLARALIPRKTRRPSRPSRGSVQRRLDSKRRRSTIKRRRTGGEE